MPDSLMEVSNNMVRIIGNNDNNEYTTLMFGDNINGYIKFVFSKSRSVKVQYEELKEYMDIYLRHHKEPDNKLSNLDNKNITKITNHNDLREDYNPNRIIQTMIPGSGITKYKCEICGVTLDSYVKTNNHYISEHVKKESLTPTINNYKYKTRCNSCGEEFHSDDTNDVKNRLNIHLEREHNKLVNVP